MTIFSIRLLPLLILLTLVRSVFSQDNITVFWQPQAALTYKVSDDYGHNFGLANRNFIYNNGTEEFSVRQVDLSHFSKWTIKDNQSISLGLLWRNSKIFDDARSNEFRITEQYNIISRPLTIRYAHRIRAEQRIFPNLTIHRFRYRFGLDFPLQGQKLDVGEA